MLISYLDYQAKRAATLLSKRNTEIAALNGRHFRRQEPGHPGQQNPGHGPHPGHSFSGSGPVRAVTSSFVATSSALPATITGVESSVIATAISSSAAATGTASAQSPTYSTIQNVSAFVVRTGDNMSS